MKAWKKGERRNHLVVALLFKRPGGFPGIVWGARSDISELGWEGSLLKNRL